MGETSNLMDYNGGTHLAKWQWDIVHDPALVPGVFEGDGRSEYSSGEAFAKLLQLLRCAYASGDNELNVPEQFLTSSSGEVGAFDYGLTTQPNEIDGLKIRSASWKRTGTSITGINNPKIDASRGEINYNGFLIKVSPATFNLNNGVSPFEHLRQYLQPRAPDIQAEFNKVWSTGLSQKLQNKGSLSSTDIAQLKQIASCASRHLDPTSRFEIVKGVLEYSTREYYEDLILDLISSTPAGAPSKDLFTRINSSKVLLDALIRGMDNLGGNERNFDRLAIEFYNLFNKAYSETEQKQLYTSIPDHRKFFFYGFGEQADLCKWLIEASREDAVVTFEETQIVAYQPRTYSPLSDGSSVPLCDTKTEKYTVGLDQLIAVTFLADNTVAKKGETILLPASVYYILIKSYWNDQRYQAAAAIWTVIGIVTPVDEFYLLGKAIQLGARGFRAVRLNSVKLFATNRKIIVNLGDEGKALKQAAEERGVALEKYVEWGLAKGADDVFKHINVSDFTSLHQATTVARSGGVRAINNVKMLVNERKALVVSPKVNTELAKKVDDYVAAFKNGNSTQQGQLGEEIAELLAKEVDNGDVLNVKINTSGHGFDVLQFENGVGNPSKIRMIESKPLSGTSVELPSTNTGTQMSAQWQRAKIDEMLNSTNSEIRALGQVLDNSEHLVERYVLTVDKDLKQVIVVRLDNF